MSILIDNVTHPFSPHAMTEHKKGKWYIAKPELPYYSLKHKWMQIKDALRVLRGKSFAVHYHENNS